MKHFLEVIACSVEDAVAAERGGADRLELISHYEVGGLTPPLELVQEVLAAVSIPVRVMLRDDESFCITDEQKKEALCRCARSLNELRIEGLVLGFLRQPGPGIDHDLLSRVLESAPDLKATFHRASEELPDPGEAIEALKRHRQIDYLLTSGGPGPWAGKAALLADWERRARPEQTILVGGGVDEEAIRILRRETPLTAFHVGQAVREDRRIDGAVIAERVAAIVELLGASH